MNNLIGRKLVHVAESDDDVTEHEILKVTGCDNLRTLSGVKLWLSDYKPKRVNVICEDGKISQIWIG